MEQGTADGTGQKKQVHHFLPHPEAEALILTSKPSPGSLRIKRL